MKNAGPNPDKIKNRLPVWGPKMVANDGAQKWFS